MFDKRLILSLGKLYMHIICDSLKRVPLKYTGIWYIGAGDFNE